MLSLFRAKCLPILLYGTEACPLLSRQKHSLEFTVRGRPYMTSTAGGGGSAPCGRLWTGGGGVEQVYDVRMVFFRAQCHCATLNSRLDF